MAARFPFKWSAARIGVHILTVVSYWIVHTSLMWDRASIFSRCSAWESMTTAEMPVRYFMEFPTDVIGYAMWVTAYTVYHNWLRTKDIETQLVSARLASLTHQLQPHFLFNALNAVSATMYEDVAARIE